MLADAQPRPSCPQIGQPRSVGHIWQVRLRTSELVGAGLGHCRHAVIQLEVLALNQVMPIEKAAKCFGFSTGTNSTKGS
jgi:hypothetical protein